MVQIIKHYGANVIIKKGDVIATDIRFPFVVNATLSNELIELEQ